MTKMSIAEAKAHFAECVRASEHGRKVLITRHGQPVAALVPVADLRRLEPDHEERGGLASLIGKWGDMEEFVENVEEVYRSRSRSRPLPKWK